MVGRAGARFRGRQFPCVVGRGGVTKRKSEGDGATPEGIHRFVGLLYRPDRVSAEALPDWAMPIGPFDMWSDDPKDPDYNQFLMGAQPYAYSAERLYRPDPLYDIVLLTDWNWPQAVPGRGSAIFVHTWRRPGYPTAGCVGFARRDLLWIASRLRPWDKLVIR